MQVLLLLAVAAGPAVSGAGGGSGAGRVHVDDVFLELLLGRLVLAGQLGLSLVLKLHMFHAIYI